MHITLISQHRYEHKHLTLYPGVNVVSDYKAEMFLDDPHVQIDVKMGMVVPYPYTALFSRHVGMKTAYDAKPLPAIAEEVSSSELDSEDKKSEVRRASCR